MLQINKLFVIIFTLFCHAGYAQSVKTKLVDAVTKEPIYGATIQCIDEGCLMACTSDHSGEFDWHSKDCKLIRITNLGYISQTLEIKGLSGIINLTPTSSLLNEVVITANRGEAIKRSQAPVAISTLNAKTIQDAKATSADQLLNKVSGVNMVNLGNEQHQMSIRQPMTTKSLFLYLEDGIPVRTTGLFNHNALLEMNMASVRNIEVIKGPSSSLYGSEAIGGVVNFITMAPTAVPTLRVSTQGNNIGYKKLELQSGITRNKWGFA
ncbi:MAG: TonB-dependent receptor plug domain-containing protein, partial [Flavisolibacter sp.]